MSMCVLGVNCNNFYCILETNMSDMEQIELNRYRKEMLADLRHVVEKYRAIFDWDIPDVDQAVADHLILDAVRAALVEIEHELAQIKP